MLNFDKYFNSSKSWLKFKNKKSVSLYQQLPNLKANICMKWDGLWVESSGKSWLVGEPLLVCSLNPHFHNSWHLLLHSAVELLSGESPRYIYSSSMQHCFSTICDRYFVFHYLRTSSTSKTKFLHLYLISIYWITTMCQALLQCGEARWKGMALSCILWHPCRQNPARVDTLPSRVMQDESGNRSHNRTSISWMGNTDASFSPWDPDLLGWEKICFSCPSLSFGAWYRHWYTITACHSQCIHEMDFWRQWSIYMSGGQTNAMFLKAWEIEIYVNLWGVPD